MSDPLLRLLARLPDAEPDADRAARVRLRCHALLRERTGPAEPSRAAAKEPAPAAKVGPRVLAPLTE